MMNFSMRRLTTCVATAAVVGVAVPASQAVVVTVGGNEVVFNSNGFESDTVGNNPASANATGSYQFNNTNGVTVSTGSYTATEANGATGPAEGSNYLIIDRDVTDGNANSWLTMEFTRNVNIATESFTIEYAIWGTTIGSSGEWNAFSVGDATADGTASGTANILTSYGYHVTIGDLVSFTNSGSTAVDQDFADAWAVGEWNNVVYAWDAIANVATLSVNGDSITLENQDDFLVDEDFVGVVNQFHMRANSGTSEVYIDAVPEPGSLALVGLGGLMMLRRKRAA